MTAHHDGFDQIAHKDSGYGLFGLHLWLAVDYKAGRGPELFDILVRRVQRRCDLSRQLMLSLAYLI
jgi:hypothetical protein